MLAAAPGGDAARTALCPHGVRAVDGPHMGSPGPAVPGPSLITDMRTLSGGHRQHQQHLQQQQQQQAASSAGGTAAPLPTVAELEAPPPPPPQAAPQARAESSAQGSPPQRGPHHADQLEALSQRLQAAAASEARMVEQVAAQEVRGSLPALGPPRRDACGATASVCPAAARRPSWRSTRRRCSSCSSRWPRRSSRWTTRPGSSAWCTQRCSAWSSSWPRCAEGGASARVVV